MSKKTSAEWKDVEWKTYEPKVREQKKIAAYTGTRNLYNGMLASAKSVIANSDVEEVWLLIEDDELPHKDVPDMVHTMNIKEKAKLFFPENGPNMNSKYTYMALMRAALCYLFPDQDKILSLDCDLVAMDDISDLWNLPIGDEYYLAASREPQFCVKGIQYVNVGVTLYNLKKLRDGKAMEVISALNRWPYPNLEQDAFSYLCSSRTLDMPSCYNFNAYTSPVRKGEVKILHYAGVDRWLNMPDIVKWHKTPWEDVMEMHARRVASE